MGQEIGECFSSFASFLHKGHISCTLSYGVPFLAPVSVSLEFACVEYWLPDEGSLLICNYLHFAVRSHFFALVGIFSLIIIYFTQLVLPMSQTCACSPMTPRPKLCNDSIFILLLRVHYLISC